MRSAWYDDDLCLNAVISVHTALLAIGLMPLVAQQPPTTTRPDVFRVVARANRAVELDSVAKVESEWGRVLVANPTDRVALLGLSTLVRTQARVELADSLAQRLLGTTDGAAPSATPDAFIVMARLGIARSLASGRNVLRADSIIAQARREATQLGDRRLESGMLMAQALVRARLRGVSVALPLIRESRALYPNATPSEESYRSCIEGNFATIAGDTITAKRLVSGITLARRSKEWRVYAECRVYQAGILEARGLFDASMGALDDAIVWMRRLHADAQLGPALQRGAYARLQRGEFARARQDYAEALTVARRMRDVSTESWTLSGLGELAVTLNDLTGARTFLDGAMTLHQARGDGSGIAAVRYLQGEMFDALGDIPAARTALTDAVDRQLRLGQRLFAISPLRRLARLELSQNRLDDADRALDRATELATAVRNPGWMAELPFHRAGVALARGRLDLADSLLRSMEPMELRGVGNADLAYSFHVRVADLAARRDDFPAAERALTRAMAVLRAWREAVSEKNTRLRMAEARRGWGAMGQDLPRLIAQLAQAGRLTPAFALAEASRARELTLVALQQSALSADAGSDTRVLARLRESRTAATVTDVQSTLDDSTAMLAYTAGRGTIATTVLVITKRTVSARALASIDSIATRLDRFVKLTTDGAAPTALARPLADAVLTPAIAALPPGIAKLIIVPELSLYRVPFDALPLADGRPVVEQFSVTISPSATLALTATLRARAGTLLAFGDASYAARVTPATSRARTTPLTDDVRQMPRLPYSGDEVRRVARYASQSTVLVRDAASERALRTADLRNVRVLHLATHAIVDDRSLQHNLIALTPGGGDDGQVGPDELGALRLQRALVILSGCRTVGGAVLSGEGLRGLVAPLLEAGAAAIVATQWTIGDESILPMVDRLYAQLARGKSVALALRDAKREAIHDGVPASVWAAFVVVGDGSMRVPLTPIRSAPLPWAR